MIRLAGPEHVGIGLDMFGGRSGVPADASGYPLLVDAIGRVTARKNVELITGENWLRVLEQVQGGRCNDGRENDRDERHREGREMRKRAAIAPEGMRPSRRRMRLVAAERQSTLGEGMNRGGAVCYRRRPR